MEVGYRGAIVLSIAFDVATIVLLAAFLALRAVARGGISHQLIPRKEVPR